MRYETQVLIKEAFYVGKARGLIDRGCSDGFIKQAFVHEGLSWFEVDDLIKEARGLGGAGKAIGGFFKSVAGKAKGLLSRKKPVIAPVKKPVRTSTGSTHGGLYPDKAPGTQGELQFGSQYSSSPPAKVTQGSGYKDTRISDRFESTSRGTQGSLPLGGAPKAAPALGPSIAPSTVGAQQAPAAARAPAPAAPAPAAPAPAAPAPAAPGIRTKTKAVPGLIPEAPIAPGGEAISTGVLGYPHRAQTGMQDAMAAYNEAPGQALWGGAKNFGRGLIFSPNAKGVGGVLGKGTSLAGIGSGFIGGGEQEQQQPMPQQMPYNQYRQSY